MAQEQNHGFDQAASSIPEQPQTASNPANNDENSSSIWDDILGWVSLLFAFPLFLILARLLPDLDWRWNLDRWLLFFAVFAVVYMLMQWMKWISLFGVLLSIGLLTYGSFAKGHHYGWKNAVFDYKSIVYACAEESEPIEYIATLLTVKKRTEIVGACDYESDAVVEFARNCIKENTEFNDYADEYFDYRSYIQACAICKKIHKHDKNESSEGKWNYTNDPPRRDFFAKASSSVNNLVGDCDCHAIFLASCLRAIDVKARIVLTSDHAYPEMGVKKEDWKSVKYLIKKVLFPKESNGKPLYFHEEGDTYWLNMDYTDNYPGCPFLDGTPKKVMVLNI